MENKLKVGIYVCECGPNIKDALDINVLVDFAAGLEAVKTAKSFNLLCSQGGGELIKRDIEEYGLDRIVIAACSPKEHEITFKKILKSAGLNPFLLQIANIREQCAWVIKDKAKATAKARAVINAAVNRVLCQEPLEVKEIDAVADVLVVGAGISGISAALTLSQKARKVYLLEQLPVIGGKVARYEEVFPNLECASCMMDPVMDEVLHDENIEVLTLSSLEEVLGFFGNFIVTVKQAARYVDVSSCIGCGACFEACPVSVKNEYNQGLDVRKAVYIPYAGALPNAAVIDRNNCLRFKSQECDACLKACPFGAIRYDDKDTYRQINVGAVVLASGYDLFDLSGISQYGYKKIKNVYTSLDFERLLSSTGPTNGKIVLDEGRVPDNIVIIHCTASRSKKFAWYCSGVCCMYSLKFSRLIHEKLPDVSVTHLYLDFCLPGKEAQGFFDGINELQKIRFLRMKDADSVRIDEQEDSAIITYTDENGIIKKLNTDMIVLSAAMEGALKSDMLAKICDVKQGKGGFFEEEHNKLSPVSTMKEGIFIAGCAQSPMDIQKSVISAKAAAGQILSKLVPGDKLVLEPIIACIDEDLCSGCKSCIALCPYNAISYDEDKKISKINDVLCRGCGVCAAACPSGVIKSRHFTDEQINAEIKGLFI
ncbi:MAG: CoB--CoM heterodisulfide reductase iron-sulfur subunit A family protein [Candidatus Omnitrophica bacterium]|nr:CoB--CoM heterodisulfide reductase iron-sulfur subunit A family protein [Candidatus Omnitrophota bacterium]